MPDIRSSVGLDLCEESAGIRYSPSPLCHVSPCALVSFAEGWEVTRLLVFIGLQYLGNLETSAIDEACRVLAWARLKKDGPEAGRDGKKTGRPAPVAALGTQCSASGPLSNRRSHGGRRCGSRRRKAGRVAGGTDGATAKLSGDRAAATSLLQQTIKCLSKEAPKDVLPAEVLATFPGTSLAAPRGRYDMLFTSSGLTFGGKTPLGPIAWDAVRYFLKLPCLETNRKAGTVAKNYWLVLVLSQPLLVGKQEYQCVALKASGTKAPQCPPALQSGTGDHERCAAVLKALTAAEEKSEYLVLSRFLEAMIGVDKALSPEPTTCVLEAVQAWRGVEEGVLYPLAAGLCFLPKPATFLPAEARGGHEKFGASQRGASEDILDAEAGSNSGPRGGELIIHRYNDKKPTVFSNLAGADASALLAYLASVVQHRADNVDPDMEDDEEEDPDFVVDAPPALCEAPGRDQVPRFESIGGFLDLSDREESGTNPFSTDLQADAAQPRATDPPPEAAKNPFAEGSNAAAEAAPHGDDGDVSLPKEFSAHSVESSQVDAHRQSMFQNAEACAVCGAWLGKRWMRPRHHCRMCNLSVCAACSPSMIVTKGDAGLQRVCNPCVTAMQEAAELKERVFALSDALDSITGEGDGKDGDDSEAKKSLQQGFLACEASVSKLEDLRRRHEVAFTQVGVLKKELQEAAKSREEDARKRAALESEFQAKSRSEEQHRARLEGCRQ
ncbi:POB3 [Symbiodinium necroappetens]|uniref:POB3 protein n=1 Tax=Symbiodinium necroappetens TaxID=1628268 RepID=A0A813CEU8_9DINO|nr:POB3 [Symbiodinium necroappetens]